MSCNIKILYNRFINQRVSFKGFFMSEKLRVFVCHANEDHAIVHELIRNLEKLYDADFWVDDKKLLPGQDWEMKILDALENSDAVIVCLSCVSVNKESYIQSELQFIFKRASQIPSGTIFLIPVRLDDCDVQRELRRFQWVDYFPDNAKQGAINRLILALKERAKVVRERKHGQISEGQPKRAQSGQEDGQSGKGQKGKGSINAIRAAFWFIFLLLIIIAAAIGLPALKELLNSIQNPSTVPDLTAPFLSPSDEHETPANSSDTPDETQVPTSKPEPVILLPDIGIANDCISSLWQPFPLMHVDMDEFNCVREPIYGIATANGPLSIRAYQIVNRATLYGLLTPLSTDTEVSFYLSVNSSFTQSQFWAGIVDGTDPTSSAVMMIYKADNNYIRVIGPNCTADCYLYNNDDEPIQQSNVGYMQFHLTPNTLEIPINYNYTFDRGINYSDPYLFIGYLIISGPQNPELDVMVSGLKIINK
jgi:hypothetical protein